MDLAKLRSKAAKGKHKNKCCKSNPRCKSCPVVLHRLKKSGALKLDDAALKRALIKARKW
ncbi:hypothetical protein ABMV07_04955 [Corynebacterium belfantii]|nr:hypothetical protein [Corynebacterium belfantii]